jgi:3'-phosphoadenosine 5'-phosphosulfate sulfotransferase (PAPS reductase)/FAD synthetase
VERNNVTATELAQNQALPLEMKIIKSRQRIREWYDHWRGEVYVSFSGGKDSTVLLRLVREIYPDVPAVFCDTGLEYPEVREFALSQENVEVIRAKMNFKEVVEKYEYPVVSKEQARFIHQVRYTKSEHLKDIRLNGAVLADGRRGKMGKLSAKWRYLIDAPFKISAKCCDVMKKTPFKRYEREIGRRMMTGEMALDSRRRKSMYLMRGCNGFDMTRPKSTPLGFWTEQDILWYLRDYEVPYSKVYGDIVELPDGRLKTTGAERTGCMFCMFGVHLDKGENRFMRMQETHPKLWDYCIYKLGCGKVLSYIGVQYKGLF